MAEQCNIRKNINKSSGLVFLKQCQAQQTVISGCSYKVFIHFAAHILRLSTADGNVIVVNSFNFSLLTFLTLFSLQRALSECVSIEEPCILPYVPNEPHTWFVCATYIISK